MRPPFSPDAAVTAAPISLPEITDEMVERATDTYAGGTCADSGMRAALTEFRDELLTGATRWQPIEHDQIRAGMRIRATTVVGDGVATRTGVAHHTNICGDWFTEASLMLTGRGVGGDPTTYEVDPATIPADPDADLDDTLWRVLCDDDLCAVACAHCAARASACKRLVREHDEAVQA